MNFFFFFLLFLPCFLCQAYSCKQMLEGFPPTIYNQILLRICILKDLVRNSSFILSTISALFVQVLLCDFTTVFGTFTSKREITISRAP